MELALNIIFNSSSSSSSSEEEFEEHRERQRIPRINIFLEIIAQYNNKQFQEHFRVSRNQFEHLMVTIHPSLQRQEGSKGRLQIPVEKQILATLWLLATPDSYRSIGCRFNMGKSSLFICFKRVITALNEVAPRYIKWPDNDERRILKQTFQQIAGLPGVIGAIDGTYVAIKAPSENPEVYINRKCFHAITLQAICTPGLKFIDCFTGYPSSVSDIRIFRNSDIYGLIQNNRDHYLEHDEHLIGDKAYPILQWCIPPYIDRGNLTERQNNFNTVHAKTRQVIERAFTLLFGRFRRLKYLDMNRVDLIPSTIIAACTLHNICLQIDDNFDNFINEGIEHINGDEHREFVRDRDDLNEGQIKRNYLAAIIN